jgi:MoaA/NifB/PqqE/SkfB family radical SAM enzyme
MSLPINLEFLDLLFRQIFREKGSYLETTSQKCNRKMKPPKERGIGALVALALWRWGRTAPRSLFFLLRTAFWIWRANARRRRIQDRIEGHIPTVVAISPTMNCNYHCRGCYSRGRPATGELTTAELDALFCEATELGVLTIVVTGGEPLLREDMLDLIEKHRRLLFVPITNGSLVTADTARRIARSGNVVLLVSIEGKSEHTDERRGKGAHEKVLRAFRNLKAAGACFGFAATNTTANSAYLGSDEFIEEMMERGCTVGFFSEYVPCGPHPRAGWVLGETERDAFRSKVLQLRQQKPIVLVQFPQDEYGADNICSAAGQASLHINAQGGVEPCPFVPVTCDNIRNGGLRAACCSSFLGSIRDHPPLLKRQRYACSLFEHLPEIEALAASCQKEQRSRERFS